MMTFYGGGRLLVLSEVYLPQSTSTSTMTKEIAKEFLDVSLEVLSIRDLDEVLDACSSCSRMWNPLGLRLGLKNDFLERLSHDCHSTEDCLRAMLEGWLKRNYKESMRYPIPSWRILCVAIATAGKDRALALDIASAHKFDLKQLPCAQSCPDMKHVDRNEQYECACGECTVEDIKERPCPKPNRRRSSAIITVTPGHSVAEALSISDDKIMESQTQSTEEIMRRFRMLLYKSVQAIKDIGIKAEDVWTFIQLNVEPKERHGLPAKASDSYAEIIQFIPDVVSWFHFELMEDMVKVYLSADSPVHESWAQYKVELSHYAAFSTVLLGKKIIGVRMDEKYSDLNMKKDIPRLKATIAKCLLIERSRLTFITVLENPRQVIFSTPDEMPRSLSQERASELALAGILEVEDQSLTLQCVRPDDYKIEDQHTNNEQLKTDEEINLLLRKRTQQLETQFQQQYQEKEKQCQVQLQDAEMVFQDRERQFQDRERQFQDTEMLFQDRERQFQDTERLFQDRERQFQNTEMLFQDRERHFQNTEMFFQDRERQFQNTERLYRQCQEQLQEKERELQGKEEQFQQCKQKLLLAHQQLQELQQQLRQAQQQVITQGCTAEESNWVVSRDEIIMTDCIVGRGGYGEVRVAHYHGLKVAAKVLHDTIISSYNVSVFSREMLVASRVRHPNLLQFIGATSEGTPIILMELMPTSLRKELETGGLNYPAVLSISLDVACALNYLHFLKPHPVLHRDVSSGNVLLQLVGNGWKAKLSDYGSANLQPLVGRTVNPGNPVYAAPEATNPREHSPAMDVFSYGVLLLEMISRRIPLPEERQSLIDAIKKASFKCLVQRCLIVECRQRPTMSDIIIELNDTIG